MLITISTPSTDTSMFVMGVNHEKYKTHEIVSAMPPAPLTALALAKVMHDNLGILEGLTSIVYVINTTQKITGSQHI